MQEIYLCMVVFLLVLAVFDIVVGVSNDAVNFINSAVGARAAKLRSILWVAAVGVFVGAALSNGMMDIARHGIFTPEYFSFAEVMYIFLAVMVTDVVILDVFNTMGMPTSTTVSMVFELLGSAFALALLKTLGDSELSLGVLLNTDKALQVIVAIFLSVAVAFVFGWAVMWVSRLLFTFGVDDGGRIKKGVFAGISLTAIVYFLLINGLKGSSLMTPEVKAFIEDYTLYVMIGCGGVFSLLMTMLSFLKVNVLRIVVLSGTFALAMAFAGNDLVNFVGVPLAGLASYRDYMASGSENPAAFMMFSLSESARTPMFYLMVAGLIMVVALMTSKKAQNVVKTSVDLSRQDEGDEMFGSSRMARSLVRATMQAARSICAVTPEPVGRWVNARFNTSKMQLTDGAAFDMLRASVNLVFAGLLVALGTSLKLPLSTTYVTFMVAMGTGLADRAWTRESAVFRVTGVLSVIGGWFITAGVAFIVCFVVCSLMYLGGIVVMVAFTLLAVFLLVRSNIRYAKEHAKKDELDEIFHGIMRTSSRSEARQLVAEHNRRSNMEVLDFVRCEFIQLTDAFFNEDYSQVKRVQSLLDDERRRWKRIRRREIIGMRRIDPLVAIEKNTWFFLANNAAEQMLYCMKRVGEPCLEHVGNNFAPLPGEVSEAYVQLRTRLRVLFDRSIKMLQENNIEQAESIRRDARALQVELSALRKHYIDSMTTRAEGIGLPNAELLYVNILQETGELISALRHLVRGISKLYE